MKRLNLFGVATLMAVTLSLALVLAQQNTWQYLGSVEAEKGTGLLKGTWQVYVDRATLQYTQQFIQASFWMEFANRPLCWPSDSNCVDRLLHSYEAYRLFCNGTAQLLGISVVPDPSYSNGTGPRPQAGGMTQVPPGTLLSLAEQALCRR